MTRDILAAAISYCQKCRASRRAKPQDTGSHMSMLCRTSTLGMSLDFMVKVRQNSLKILLDFRFLCFIKLLLRTRKQSDLVYFIKTVVKS